MADVMVPSKRSRAPSFGENHGDYSETQGTAVVLGWFPGREMGQVQVQARNFLEECRFCKKKLRHDEDVFMYGYFGAFCSKECREKQMRFDIFTDSSARAKKGRRMCGSETKPKEPIDEDEANPDKKITTPHFYISS